MSGDNEDTKLERVLVQVWIQMKKEANEKKVKETIAKGGDPGIDPEVTAADATGFHLLESKNLYPEAIAFIKFCDANILRTGKNPIVKRKNVSPKNGATADDDDEEESLRGKMDTKTGKILTGRKKRRLEEQKKYKQGVQKKNESKVVMEVAAATHAQAAKSKMQLEAISIGKSLGVSDNVLQTMFKKCANDLFHTPGTDDKIFQDDDSVEVISNDDVINLSDSGNSDD